jgi:peptidoglycan-associated lipoprotein
VSERRRVMKHLTGGRSQTFVFLALALLLAGCPKSPKPGSAAGGASGSGPAAAMTSGTGAAGTGGSAMGSAGGGAGGGQGTGSGSGVTTVGGAGRATGTTLPALPSPSEFSETTTLRDVQFAFDRADILPAGKAVLDANARWLKAHQRAAVLIEGHCDERGTNEYNLALGERRARATRDYLAAAGIADSRITVVSYGEERPLCTDGSETCWARNRRAHFLVKE